MVLSAQLACPALCKKTLDWQVTKKRNDTGFVHLPNPGHVESGFAVQGYVKARSL